MKYSLFYSLMIPVFFIEGDNIESAIEILNSELEKNIDMANRKQTNFKCFEITFHDFPSC